MNHLESALIAIGRVIGKPHGWERVVRAAGDLWDGTGRLLHDALLTTARYRIYALPLRGPMSPVEQLDARAANFLAIPHARAA